MALEIELKLDLDTAGLARLRRHPLLKVWRQGRALTKALKTVYYDTADHALRAAGVTLRVRHSGRQRVLTVKSDHAGGTGHFDRNEWEVPLLAEHPNALTLASLPLAGHPVEHKLAKAMGQGVIPVFTTAFKRTSYKLAEAGADSRWEVVLCLDEGSVDTATASVPLCEAEIELSRGSAGDLFRVALALTEGQSALPGIKAKAQRGFDLLAGRVLLPAKAVESPLTPEQTVADGFRAIARSCLTQALHNAHCLRETSHHESVHQMRVGLRRLRSALALFAPLVGNAGGATFRAELQWAATELGDARDYDVFLAEVVAPVVKAYPERSSLKALAADVGSRRDAGYERALAAVHSPRLAKLILDLGAWIEDGLWSRPADPAIADTLASPIAAYAAGILTAQRHKVLKKGKRFADLPAVDRHELRITLKKLRYATDFFRTLWTGKAARTYILALSTMQDGLGHLNDIAVAEGVLEGLAQEAGASSDRAFAAGLIAGWHGQSGALALVEATKAWKAFSKTDPYWV